MNGLRRNLVVAMSVLALLLAPHAGAAILTWDSDGNAGNGATDGAGSWDTATALWFNGGSDVIWNNGTPDQAIIGAGSGAAGTITLTALHTEAPGNARDINFDPLVLPEGDRKSVV